MGCILHIRPRAAERSFQRFDGGLRSSHGSTWAFRTAAVAYLLCFGLVVRGAREPGLAAEWTFDDVQGPAAADASGNDNDLQITHAVVVPGVRGAALRFIGLGSCASAPHSGAFCIADALTIEAWVQPTKFPPPDDYATIVRKEGAFALRFGGGAMRSSIGLLVWMDGAPDRLESPPLRWRAGEWHHVAGTFDGKQMRLYVDGREVASLPIEAPASVDVSGDACFVGGCGVKWPFRGAIDEVRIYERCLDANEIAARYADGRKALAAPNRPQITERTVGETRPKAPDVRLKKPEREVTMVVPGFIWIDAEDFNDYGGWVLDTQFVYLAGSGFLLAAGVGEPVEDARTTFTLPEGGTWRVWVRSRNWLPEFSPGTFQVLLNGRPLAQVFGRQSTDKWTWESGGAVDLGPGRVEMALHDLTGFYGRCDAIVLTRDPDYRPPNEIEDIWRERSRLTGLSLTPQDGGEYDVVVVGAGAAGSVAALASARLGAKTALVQNRPVLGGNASVELGVGVNGAASTHPNARETGIIEEVGRIKARYGFPKWSGPFQMAAKGEKNLHVFLNQHVCKVEMNGGDRIASVLSVDTLTNRITRFRGRFFIDCTGDGWVGYYAGAEYRLGREARSEFNESLAPEKADSLTMSGCLMGKGAVGFRAVDTGKPCPYTPPPWAYQLPEGDAFGRRIRHIGAGEWWLEHPNSFDDLWEAERCRDELIRISFGYWDYIKNKWPERKKAETWRMVFIPMGLAKRESRRLVGDYILTQNDVQSGRVFPDRISYGGWPLDVHHPKGILSGREGPFYCDPHVPIYTIPYRCLYSKNIRNLFFAGRNVSVTHIALGSVRVQGTLATLGQAAGTAAVLCLKHGLEPRELGRQRIGELQQVLLKYDQTIPEVRNEDPRDLARRAHVTASSTAEKEVFTRRDVREGRTAHPLNMPRAVIFPTGLAGAIRRVYVRLASTRERPTAIVAHVRAAAAPEAFASSRDAAVVRADLAPGRKTWLRFDLPESVEAPWMGVWLEPADGVEWPLMRKAPSGARRAYGDASARNWTVRENECYAFYTDPPVATPAGYSPEYVINGIARIVGDQSNMWASSPDAKFPQWIELHWEKPVTFNTVNLTFDTNLNLPFHSLPMPAECVRSYTIAGWIGKEWKILARVRGNFLRWRTHRFAAVTTDRLRITVTATNGAPCARIFEVRVYNEASPRLFDRAPAGRAAGSRAVGREK